MRISKEEQQKTHCKLVEAAVHVISHHGFRNATMHEIAERAQVGDATIYKYFPTKESLLFAFFELRLDDLIERLSAIEDFSQYNFQEQLHVLLETQLEIFEPDRAFIRIAYEGVFLTNWIATAAGSTATKDRFVAIVEDLVTSAVEAGEFEEPPFTKLFSTLLWEFAIGVTYYWLEDSSPKYINTTQMLDKSLALLDAMLKSKILSRLADLTQFLIREHLLSKIQMAKNVSTPNPAKPKRQFMAKDTPPTPRPAKKG
jgi:AcrR family transcriptional regulator